MPRELWGLSVTNRTGHTIRVEGVDILPEKPGIRLHVPSYERLWHQDAPLVFQRSPARVEIERASHRLLQLECDLVIVNMVTLRWLTPEAARHAAAITSRDPHTIRRTHTIDIENRHLIVRNEFYLIPDEWRDH